MDVSTELTFTVRSIITDPRRYFVCHDLNKQLRNLSVKAYIHLALKWLGECTVRLMAYIVGIPRRGYKYLRRKVLKCSKEENELTLQQLLKLKKVDFAFAIATENDPTVQSIIDRYADEFAGAEMSPDQLRTVILKEICLAYMKKSVICRKQIYSIGTS